MIAKLIGKPRNSRQIGFALKGLARRNRGIIEGQINSVGNVRAIPMSQQFDPNDGFLDERMFINNNNNEESVEDANRRIIRNLRNQNRNRNQPNLGDDSSSNESEDSDENTEEDNNTLLLYQFHTGNVPWWRVIGSGGIVSVRSRPEDRDNQVNRLEEEGIQCIGYRVNMKEFEWNPPRSLFDPEG